MPHDTRPRLLMSPRGAPLTQSKVAELAHGPGVTIVCARFGVRVATRISHAKLAKGFAGFLLVVGVWMIVRSFLV